MSDDSSSEMMELDESAMASEPQLEQNLRRLREEENLLREQQATMEAGAFDDIAALEHQDALRLNQLQQQELQRQQAAHAARHLRQTHGQGQALALEAPPPRREQGARRRATCTVRVNNLHATEAIETDV